MWKFWLGVFILPVQITTLSLNVLHLYTTLLKIDKQTFTQGFDNISFRYFILSLICYTTRSALLLLTLLIGGTKANVGRRNATLLSVGRLNATLLSVGRLNATLLSVGERNPTLLSAGRLNATLLSVGRLNATLLSVGRLNATLLSVGERNPTLLSAGRLNATLLSVGRRNTTLLSVSTHELNLARKLKIVIVIIV